MFAQAPCVTIHARAASSTTIVTIVTNDGVSDGVDVDDGGIVNPGSPTSTDTDFYFARRMCNMVWLCSSGQEDNDGQFLLIEAAEALPDWINPENSSVREWRRVPSKLLLSVKLVGMSLALLRECCSLRA